MDDDVTRGLRLLEEGIGGERVVPILPDDAVCTLGAFGSQDGEIRGILKGSRPGTFPQFLLTFPGAPEKRRRLNKTFPRCSTTLASAGRWLKITQLDFFFIVICTERAIARGAFDTYGSSKMDAPADVL